MYPVVTSRAESWTYDQTTKKAILAVLPVGIFKQNLCLVCDVTEKSKAGSATSCIRSRRLVRFPLESQTLGVLEAD
jgi:hypothetical protein